MKNVMAVPVLGGLICVCCLVSSCEWSGGSDGGFNTSRAGLEVNISGVYKGTLSGGLAVANTSGVLQPNNFLIQQSGNAIEVTDSNGQKYRGTVGAPGAVLADFGTTIPSGAQLASFQLSWRGTDGVASKEIDFSGVINVIAVTDVQGQTTSRATSNSNTSEQNASRQNSTENSREQSSSSGSSEDQGNSSQNGQSSSQDSSQDVVFNNEQTQGTEISQTVNVGNGTATESESSSSSLSTDITQNSANGSTSESGSTFESSENSSSETTLNNNSAASTENSTATTASSSNENNTEFTTTFELTEANSQFRLQGTWIEEGGVISPVEARSSGAGRLTGGTTEGVAGTTTTTGQ